MRSRANRNRDGPNIIKSWFKKLNIIFNGVKVVIGSGFVESVIFLSLRGSFTVEHFHPIFLPWLFFLYFVSLFVNRYFWHPASNMTAFCRHSILYIMWILSCFFISKNKQFQEYNTIVTFWSLIVVKMPMNMLDRMIMVMMMFAWKVLRTIKTIVKFRPLSQKKKNHLVS